MGPNPPEQAPRTSETAAEPGDARARLTQPVEPPPVTGRLTEGLGYVIKRKLLGKPLVTEQLSEERLSKPLALGVLSCDGISSVP